MCLSTGDFKVDVLVLVDTSLIEDSRLLVDD